MDLVKDIPHLRQNALIQFNFSTSREGDFPTGRQLQLLLTLSEKVYRTFNPTLTNMMDLFKDAQNPLTSLTKSVTSLKPIKNKRYFAEEADQMLLSLPVLLMLLELGLIGSDT